MTRNRNPEKINQIFARWLANELVAAMPETWERRARAFEAARPKPGDFIGRASAADLAAIDRRCRESAEACRNKAQILRWYGPGPDVLAEIEFILADLNSEAA